MDLYVWFLVKFYIAPDPLSRAKLSFFSTLSAYKEVEPAYDGTTWLLTIDANHWATIDIYKFKIAAYVLNYVNI